MQRENRSTEASLKAEENDAFIVELLRAAFKDKGVMKPFLNKIGGKADTIIKIEKALSESKDTNTTIDNISNLATVTLDQKNPNPKGRKTIRRHVLFRALEAKDPTYIIKALGSTDKFDIFINLYNFKNKIEPNDVKLISELLDYVNKSSSSTHRITEAGGFKLFFKYSDFLQLAGFTVTDEGTFTIDNSNNLRLAFATHIIDNLKKPVLRDTKDSKETKLETKENKSNPLAIKMTDKVTGLMDRMIAISNKIVNKIGPDVVEERMLMLSTPEALESDRNKLAYLLKLIPDTPEPEELALGKRKEMGC